ncbi:Maf family protein [Desulfovibrio sp. ZJ369]|uniref:Maf family protein n=1 Tax=Desulfovibrio sp. ZJ369 TaxID=2709793 RepID=UPI0013ED0763|nr:Maf family protein [Desulfovibrio sp. ZJ369]
MKALFALAPGIRLLLASSSPRRRQFLEEWGLPFVPARPDKAEPHPEPGEEPRQYAVRAAEAKALAVARQPACADALVLAADTVVALEGDILGKPRDQAHALRMLERLSGRSHEVISAVCLVLPQGRTPAPAADAERPKAEAAPPGRLAADLAPHMRTASGGRCRLSFSDTSRVFFHPWPGTVLRAYVRTHEPDDKAGAYAIQGQGAFLVERVEGSWSTVVGLPVTALARILLDQGLMLPVHACKTL